MNREILKAFLRSITGNDIMKTNNSDYGCVDAFMATDKYKELNQVNNINCDAMLASRYFAVAYIGTHPKGKYTGMLNINTDGEYLNSKLTLENIKKASGDVTHIVITNIIEMTKDDFDSWTNEG